MKDFMIYADNKVQVRQRVTFNGEPLFVVCGYLSMSALIRAAAYRGGVDIRDQRQSNF